MCVLERADITRTHLSKIIGEHVFKHLYEFLNANDLLTDTQFYFRSQIMQTVLLTLTEKMYQVIYDGNYFGMIQLDLSKS